MENEEQPKQLSHYQLKAAQQKQKEVKDSRYRERSKKRLANIITTKIRTAFIGAIAAVEEGFGFMWGHDKPESELTEDEKTMAEVWEAVRASILDNGNGQLRGAINEIHHNSVHWDRYHVEIPIKTIEETKETE